jgi:hypothetical protein
MAFAEHAIVERFWHLYLFMMGPICSVSITSVTPADWKCPD